ncbi:MAG TPA: phosphoribosylamine--glycine ligase [Chitinophagaceae bacterium]
MNILLLGSGGREHALAWKLSQSKHCSKLLIAPGNPGTAQCGINRPFAVTDFEGIKQCCREEAIDMVIVGPEEPLVNGIVDDLKAEFGSALMIIGPSKEAAQLEGSKAYAKAFMQRHGIPTAAYSEFTAENFGEGVEYLHNQSLPIVLKADGLAAGKGVLICQSHMEAVAGFEEMIQDEKFGEAGKRVVVEEFLQGIELSVFVLTDGIHYVLLPEAKDYKRIGEGDTGLNTGGMGAVSPVPFADEAFMQKVITRIVEPTVQGLQKDNLDYKGFVFIGLMKVGDEPYVIEYNCRMGDPETEVVMPRVLNDLAELLAATAKGELQHQKIEQDPRYATTIMAVSGGYPADYRKGLPISGLDASLPANTFVFQAGTKEKDGTIVTSGGRVLCVTSLSESLPQALEASRNTVEAIQYEDKYYRRDIGYEFI